MNVKMEEGWKAALEAEFSKDYFQSLTQFLKLEIQSGKTVYPAGSQMFAAFDKTPFDKVKVVLLGQDPYHGPGQAMGLSFSVNKGKSLPPSLQNIYKELKSDLGIAAPSHGDLSEWAEQGVLLLNTSLTVRAKEAGSHAKAGWWPFTDAAIKTLSDQKQNLVFILWGKHAQEKKALINKDKHRIIESAHPSPYSADRGFFGSHPFSQTNEYLAAHGIDPVDWKLTP